VAERPEGDKTEEPTPRRLEEARRQGEVAQSRDLTQAAALLVVVGALSVAAPAGIGRLVAYVRRSLEAAPRGTRDAALTDALHTAAAVLALPLGAVVVTVVLVGMLQSGGLFTLRPARLDLARVLPQGRRVLSGQALMTVAKGLVKLAVVTGIAWLTLKPTMRALAALPGASARTVLEVLGVVTGRLAVRLAMAAAVLGAADYLLQRRRHLRQLRMTRDEVRREHKESEGDPHHRAERQRLHRELGEQRMLADVRKADFVVVNPDHIAVALRYDRDGTAAPVVVAKGERLLAEKIKEVAREAGVPIFRDVPLARALAGMEEGDEIPEALYEAVAEILRVVYAESPAPRPTATPATAPPGPWRRA
jgi:flagellar biosynthesis protein FlhB